MQRHIAWDIGIAGVTERLSAVLDATAVLQTYSRLVIDCNRDPSWPSAMPEISEHTPIPGNIGLSQQDRERASLPSLPPITTASPACSMLETARTDAPS